MPRNKKRTNLSESYVSLILGFLVVLAVSIFGIVFAKNRTYDKINTAISTFQAPQKNAQTSEKQNPGTYEVKSGDNLWTIAENIYGSGYNWVDLSKANKLKNPDLIFAGNKLVVPEAKKITVRISNENIASPPSESITASMYSVQKGDDLWDIAVRKYGDGYKWPEIARVNEISNPDLIYADTVLKLP